MDQCTHVALLLRDLPESPSVRYAVQDPAVLLLLLQCLHTGESISITLGQPAFSPTAFAGSH
jgi:hypothetical protein